MLAMASDFQNSNKLVWAFSMFGSGFAGINK